MNSEKLVLLAGGKLAVAAEAVVNSNIKNISKKINKLETILKDYNDKVFFSAPNNNSTKNKKQTVFPDKAYLVSYRGRGNDYENSVLNTVFVTNNELVAQQYVKRFNSILKKWKEYYTKFEGKDEFGYGWIKEEYVETWFERWYRIMHTSKCSYEEIRIR